MKNTRLYLKFPLAAALSLGIVLAEAATVHVAKTGHDDTGDGTSENPYLTIQAAINKASAGDTVLVGEGDFSDVGDTIKITVDSFGFSVPTVVHINKQITLQGAGRGKTFITGAYGNGTAQDGSGNDYPDTGVGAHRCIYASATGAVIRDFTIRRGATVRAKTSVNNNVDSGGGVLANGTTCYLYDCDILDCRAGFGAATSRDVRACRCRFAGNQSKENSNQVMYRNSYTYNCLFENNGTDSAASGSDGCIFTRVQPHTVVNCTFINNKVATVFLQNMYTSTVYNCLFVGDRAVLSGLSAANKPKYELDNVVETMADSQLSTLGANNVAGANAALQYYAPAADDWRSVEGNAIVGKGMASILTTAVTGFPAAELETDFAGNPRRSGGTVSIGCFEPTNVVSAAKLYGSFAITNGVTVTKGGTTYSGANAVPGRWWAVSEPGQVRVAYTASDELFGCEVVNEGGVLGGVSYTGVRFPDNRGDKGFWLTLTPGGVATITALPASEVKWVDADADASAADGTEAKPYKTIAAALEKVASRALVKVKPGTYDEGTSVSGSKNYRINLTKDVAIRSTEGAGETILKGGSDIEAIVLSTDKSRSAHLQGFTLTGSANDPSRDTDQGTTGAALLCNVSNESARAVSEGVHLTDSIISNNVAAARTCVGGWLERCLLIDNFTTVANMDKGTNGSRGTQAYGSILSGCVSYYSPTYYAAGYYPTANTCAHQNCTDINCTFYIPTLDAGNHDYRTLNTPNGSTVAINNAMVDPKIDGYTPDTERYAAGNISSPGIDKDGHTKGLASGTFFVDSAARDFRPLDGSVGLGYSVVTSNRFVRYETGDFNGMALAYESNGGKPIPGAFQMPTRLLTITPDPLRGEISPSNSLYVTDGQTVTVTATETTVRKFLGWNVNGTFVAAQGLSYTYTADFASSATLTLAPVFATNLYVNAAAANDDGDGLSPETAKKYLASVAPLTYAGDVIHAAAGDYCDGQMTQTEKMYGGTVYSPSRIVLKAGVSLVADEGPDVTFITGYPKKGENGIRCVAAFAGAVVRGFTLRNGATSATTGGEYDENEGGCALAPKATSVAATALFEDCVISNGAARMGGCVAGGFLRRCRVSCGTSGAGASLTHYSALENTLALGNSNTGVRQHYGIRSSVVINLERGGTYYDMAAMGDSVCENSIIALRNADLSISGASHKNMRNCIWNVGGDVVKIDDATCCNVITCEVSLTSFEAAFESLKLDDAGRPCAGSPALDRGDNALLATLSDSVHDLYGAQRVYNAVVDLGACEYACTNEFTAAICTSARRARVTSASPMVALGSSGLAVPADGEVEIRWTRRRDGETADLTVDDLASGATLKVYAGTELLTTISAVGTTRLTSDAEVMNLRLVAEGGTVRIASFNPGRYGFAIIIR